MKILLRIDAGARRTGSHTRTVADYFVKRWRHQNPTGEVLVRDLASDPVPHLSNDMIEAFQEAGSGTSLETELSDRLIEELKAADHILISSPLYNGTLPSPLKAYLDHVVRSGHTFEIRKGHYVGLLAGKSATVITARGGRRVDGVVDDYQTDYLRSILAFMSISPVECIELDAMAFDEDTQHAQHQAAMRKVDWMFSPHGQAEWCGGFSLEEKVEISALRDAQARAIVTGDAQAYANLCADNVQLLIPGHDMILGKDALFTAERDLFARAVFKSFEKTPVRIERNGGLIVETGIQVVTMQDSGQSEGVFSSRQKYMHIYRQTSQGLSFAFLMSNPCG